MDETPAVDWSALDKLSSGKWAPEVLRVRRGLVEKVAKASAKAGRAEARLKRRRAALQAFDDKLRPRMKRRRKRLLRLFGAHITTDDGQIVITDRKNVLDYDPKRSKELVAELKRRRAPRKTIRVVESPAYETIAQMTPSFIRSFAHVGVSIGQMFYMSIKSTGEDKATNIVRHRRGE